jgi:hypothetical protein
MRNSYNISELELQALREIVTISQNWNYKHCYNYLQCLIVGITIIARNSYNISYCNQTLALIGVVVHRGGVTCISYRHQLSGCWLQQLLLPIAADLSADRNIIQVTRVINVDCNSSKMLITTSFKKLIKQVLHVDCISFEYWLQHHLTPVHSFDMLATLLGSLPHCSRGPLLLQKWWIHSHY